MDFNKAINRETFPHRTEKGAAIATIANLEHLLNSYGIQVSYNEVLKQQYIAVGESINDLSESSKYAQIKSLLALNYLPLSTIDLLPAILERHTVNPLLDWIKNHATERIKTKDKHNYVADLIKTLTTVFYLSEGTRLIDRHCFNTYAVKAIKTWLYQSVAALDGAINSPRTDKIAKYELVLVLQGEQGIGKTTWLSSLLPNEFNAYFKAGAHLDIADKDSVKKCISTWLCELGELDSTFRKSDIARLKAFLSNEYDEIRLPYDRVSSAFKRRTSFCASVNPKEFLTDSTGSRRFLPIEVEKCARHNLDMGKVWGQVYAEYLNGAAWWCDEYLEQLLIQCHEIHAETNVIHELITERYDLSAVKGKTILRFEHLTTTQILQACEIKLPNKEQIKQAKQFLEKKGLREIKIMGKRGFWIAKRLINTELDDTL